MQVLRANFAHIAATGALLLGRSVAGAGTTLSQNFSNAQTQFDSLHTAFLRFKVQGVPVRLLTPMMDLVDPLKHLGGQINYPENNAPELVTSPVSRLVSATATDFEPLRAKVENDTLKRTFPVINPEDDSTLPFSVQVVKNLAAATADSEGVAPLIALTLP